MTEQELAEWRQDKVDRICECFPNVRDNRAILHDFLSEEIVQNGPGPYRERYDKAFDEWEASDSTHEPAYRRAVISWRLEIDNYYRVQTGTVPAVDIVR